MLFCKKSAVPGTCISASVFTWLVLSAAAFIDTRQLKLKDIPQGTIIGFANAPTNAYRETGLFYRTTINKDTVVHFLKKAKRAAIEGGYDPKSDRSVIPTAGVFVLTNGQMFFWRLWTRTLTIENTNCEMATLVLDAEDKYHIQEDPRSNEPKDLVAPPTLRSDNILSFARGPCSTMRFGSNRLTRVELDRVLKTARIDTTMSHSLPRNLSSPDKLTAEEVLGSPVNGDGPLDFGIVVTKDFQIVYWTLWSKKIIEIRTENSKSAFLIAE